MSDDMPHREWSSRFHTSPAVYHEPPAGASTQRPATREDRFEAQPSLHMTGSSASNMETNRLYPSHLLGPLPPTLEQPMAKPFTRRYDPVRDSVASSSSPAPSQIHTAPVRSSKAEDRKPFIPALNSNVSDPNTGRLTIGPGFKPLSRDNDDTRIRARISRQIPRSPESFTIADLRALSSQLVSSDNYIPVTDRSELSAVSGSNADDVLGTAERFEVTSLPVRTRDGGDAEGVTDERSRNHVPKIPCVDTKGKGKAVVEQSPAFRLDNLLEPCAGQPPPKDSEEDYERCPSESHTDRAPSESSYVFTGRLPPPPFIGSSTAASTTTPAAHTSIPYLGITVSQDVDISRFLSADEFEKSVRANPGPFTEFSLSALAGETAPNAKRARKHGPSSQRRKARGLFPQDNVPLAISTTTSKQSRYRPSGDRQPVACGYKDPITQIQCDEPFNRSVELRRHVRAVHVPAEALAVTMGQLTREQATLLPADWKPGDGDVLRPKCLCGKEFSRLDALRRHWTGVQAEIVEGKCISCPSSLAKKKDHTAFEQGTESTYGAPLYS